MKRSAVVWIVTSLLGGLIAGILIGGLLLPEGLLRKAVTDTSEEERIEIPAEEEDSKVQARKSAPDLASSQDEADTAGEELLPDTLAEDTVSYATDNAGNGSSDEFILLEDELIHRAILHVSNDSIYVSEGRLNIDSMLIDDPTRYPDIERFKVEFWSSPINYKGYRLQKDKIMLYGIEHFEDATLWRVSQKLYLRYHDKFYPLNESPHFQQLVQVRAPAVNR